MHEEQESEKDRTEWGMRRQKDRGNTEVCITADGFIKKEESGKIDRVWSRCLRIVEHNSGFIKTFAL